MIGKEEETSFDLLYTEMYQSMIVPLLFFHSVHYFTVYSQNNSDKMCEDKNNRMTVLKLSSEQTFADALHDSSLSFEASGVELRSDGLVMYVIFDNFFQIGAVCTPQATQSINCTNQLIDWPDETMRSAASEFEGIAYNFFDETYFIIQETIPPALNRTTLASNIFEIRITSNDFVSSVVLIESCQVKWQFESKSKGFEGLEFMVHQNTGKRHLLALCEANNCSMATIQEKATTNLGNGQIVVLEKRAATSDGK